MSKRVLVGILNWGLGHATRSVPVIRRFMAQGYEPVIASDGLALAWLRRTFPELPAEELPSSSVIYPRRGGGLLRPWVGMQLLAKARAFRAEKRLAARWARRYGAEMIFSDNRPAFHVPGIRSVYMTHQLHVEAGIFSGAATRLHRRLMRPFDEIWVPDFDGTPNLAGRLAHPAPPSLPVKYLGPLSRLHSRKPATVIDWLLVVSGPEQQRTQLENALIRHAALFDGRVTLVRGTLRQPRPKIPSHWQVVDLAGTKELERLAAQARLIVSRSGYSSVMDWFVLRRKAILIPTPGQPEQQYLARHLEATGLYPFVPQNDLARIAHIDLSHYFDYSPFKNTQTHDHPYAIQATHS